jgi:hypothetical protein
MGSDPWGSCLTFYLGDQAIQVRVNTRVRNSGAPGSFQRAIFRSAADNRVLDGIESLESQVFDGFFGPPAAAPRRSCKEVAGSTQEGKW